MSHHDIWHVDFLDLGVSFGFKPFLHGAGFGSELCFGLFQTLKLEFSMPESWIFYSGRLSFFCSLGSFYFTYSTISSYTSLTDPFFSIHVNFLYTTCIFTSKSLHFSPLFSVGLAVVAREAVAVVVMQAIVEGN